MIRIVLPAWFLLFIGGSLAFNGLCTLALVRQKAQTDSEYYERVNAVIARLQGENDELRMRVSLPDGGFRGVCSSCGFKKVEVR